MADNKFSKALMQNLTMRKVKKKKLKEAKNVKVVKPDDEKKKPEKGAAAALNAFGKALRY